MEVAITRQLERNIQILFLCIASEVILPRSVLPINFKTLKCMFKLKILHHLDIFTMKHHKHFYVPKRFSYFYWRETLGFFQDAGNKGKNICRKTLAFIYPNYSNLKSISLTTRNKPHRFIQRYSSVSYLHVHSSRCCFTVQVCSRPCPTPYANFYIIMVSNMHV